MGVELLNCPSCGMPLDIKEGADFVQCQYCNSTLRIQMRNVNSDGSTTLTDKATGMVIGTVRIPFGYQAQGMLRPEYSSYTYPFGVGASAYNDKGTFISYYIGEGYVDRSKYPLLSGPYSQGYDQISKAHYKDFMDVRQYVHNYASMYANSSKATQLTFIEERHMPLYEPFNEAEALENYKRRIEFEKKRLGTPVVAKDTGYYLKGLCHVYKMTVNGADVRVAITTVLKGWKYQFPDMMGGFGGFSGGLGNLFGGLFSKGTPQTNPPQSGAFNDMPANSVIEWQSDGIFILQSLPQEFESAFKNAYTDFCSTFQLDNGIREKLYNMQSQILQDVARYTQQRLDQMNRDFQSWQQIHATQQAAFDSYTQSWWNNSNASHAAMRASSQAKMDSESRIFDGISEATRGVNTYLRPDGTEVEVSVSYDRAYTNYSGDVLGSRSAFEPGGNWTEMKKKY
jgi:LSD1 subclass zinc finger protein